MLLLTFNVPEYTISLVLSLPKGRKIMRTGDMQTDDFHPAAVAGIHSLGKPVHPLPRAVDYGAPSDEEVTHAVNCMCRSGANQFYGTTQGEFLATAQSRSDFAKGDPHYCYEPSRG